MCGIGKFKDVSALQEAYESLEKEFTKRSQQLAKLKTQVDEQDKEIDRLEKVVHDQAEQYWDCKEQAVKDTAKEIFARFKNRTHQGVDLGGFFVEITLRMEDLVWIKNRYGVEVE